MTAAIVLPRGTAHDRVLLLVLEGARGDVVRALARAGHLPTLESVIAGGVGGDISGVAETSSADQLLSRIDTITPTSGGSATGPKVPISHGLSPIRAGDRRGRHAQHCRADRAHAPWQFRASGCGKLEAAQGVTSEPALKRFFSAVRQSDVSPQPGAST